MEKAAFSAYSTANQKADDIAAIAETCASVLIGRGDLVPFVVKTMTRNGVRERQTTALGHRRISAHIEFAAQLTR